MEPFEIMISESQERMLCVVEPAQLDDGARGVRALGDAARRRSARSPTTSRLRVFDGEQLVGDMPVSALVDECPLYDLEPQRAGRPARRPSRAPRAAARAGRRRRRRRCARCSARANVASRRWVFEQYDSLVGSRTVRRPEQADAAVLRLALRGTSTPAGRSRSRSTATAAASPATPTSAPPRRSAECAANLACVGAEPLGLTNCLNFGNPEKPHVAWQLTRAVEGMAAACRALGVPVVGGNVSLYNEGPEGPIYPTPVVGMVGELPDAARAGRLARSAAEAPSRHGRADRPVRALAARLRAGAAGGQRSRAASSRSTSQTVREALELVREAVRAGVVRSAHDVSEGGLACASPSARSRAASGATLDLEPLMRRAGVDGRTALFGEGPGGIVVSGPREALLELSTKAAGVGFLALGQVGGDDDRLAAAAARIDISVEDAGGLFDSVLANRVS